MTPEFLFWLVAAHFIGDYLLQSHWMATRKTESWWAAFVHAMAYSLPFYILLMVTFGPGIDTWLVLSAIMGTHLIIDHWRLAKHIGWLKNQIGTKESRPSYEEAMANGGYPASTPAWLSTWLMIITDNLIHILINFLAVIPLFI